jgi:hypothetical protein
MESADPRLNLIAGDTEAIQAHHKEILRLRAERAKVTWAMVNDPNCRHTIASIARAIGEPEIRFRKSVEVYRDGIPNFKRNVI